MVCPGRIAPSAHRPWERRHPCRPLAPARSLSAPSPEPKRQAPTALQHDQTSRYNTKGSNPHLPASLEQLASPTQHKETSFQQVARSMQQAAKRVEHQETSFQHDARALPQLARPVERPERLRVVARTPAGGLVSSRAVGQDPSERCKPPSRRTGERGGRTVGGNRRPRGVTTWCRGRKSPCRNTHCRSPARLRCRNSLGRSSPARTSSGSTGRQECRRSHWHRQPTIWRLLRLAIVAARRVARF